MGIYNPFFSVIIPLYNSGKLLEFSILSVIDQSFTNWELIIIDDGSTDDSLLIARSWQNKDGRIKVLQHPGAKNKGVSASRNLGIKIATGKWLAFLDADDIWLPDKLKKQFDIINSNSENLLFVYCKAQIIDENGIILNEKEMPNYNKLNLYYGNGKSGLSIFPYKWVINKGFEAPTSSVVLKKDIVDIWNIKFKEHLTYSEDGLFWFEVISHGNIFYLNEPLVNYRVHLNQWNARVTDETKIARRLIAYKEMLKSPNNEYKGYITFLMINNGLRIVIRYYLAYHNFNFKTIYDYIVFIELKKLSLIYSLLTLYVLTSEVLISPIVLVKSIFKK